MRVESATEGEREGPGKVPLLVLDRSEVKMYRGTRKKAIIIYGKGEENS